jgi:hypothetical protein
LVFLVYYVISVRIHCAPVKDKERFSWQKNYQ